MSELLEMIAGFERHCIEMNNQEGAEILHYAAARIIELELDGSTTPKGSAMPQNPAAWARLQASYDKAMLQDKAEIARLKQELKNADCPEIEGTFPVVLYLGSEEDREELIQALMEIHPNMRSKKL